MANKINPMEIVFCNITLRLKNKSVLIAEGIIFSRGAGEINHDLKWSNSDDKLILARCGLKDDAVITKIDVLKSMGYKNTSESYVNVSKSDNNNRTSNGGYD